MWSSSELTWFCLLASIGLNLFFFVKDAAEPSLDEITLDQRAIMCPAESHPPFFPLRVVNRVKAEMYSQKQQELFSQHHLEKAAEYGSQSGQGRLGWLHLLSAVDYDATNVMAMYNLITNYKALGDPAFIALAVSELMQSQLSDQEKNQLISRDVIDQKNMESQVTQSQIARIPRLRKECTIRAFVTQVQTWDLFHQVDVSDALAALNDEIYHTSVSKYEQLRRDRPELSPTDLNHELFRLQMADDNKNRDVWSTFQNITGFDKLILTMRRAASQFLELHGYPKSIALQKASHPLVIWVSVHAHGTTSHHQPHVTDDALVGGVYYVRIPPSSGRLQLYDPRGKQPVWDLSDPTSHPSPPFHRSVGVQPREGKLVLFPGWLVHSVLPSSSDTIDFTQDRGQDRGQDREEVDPSEVEDRKTSKRYPHRVSISMNLKGEWKDTSSLTYDNEWCDA